MAEQKIVLRGSDSETINVGFKRINQLFSQEREFIAHKRYEVTDSNHYTSFGISTLRAIKPHVSGTFEFTSTDLTQSSTYDGLSGIYQKTLWRSLYQTHFADDSRLTLHPTASILSVPVYKFGYEIKPKSVNITNYYGSSTDFRYYTDSKIDSNFGTIVSSSATYGYIFYREGLIVMTNTSSINQNTFLGNGEWDYTSNHGFVLNYKATKTIDETNITCHIGKDEFNVSTHPTSLVSGSFGSRAGFTTSSVFSPYITTIGLYNDNDEMMAVAKLGAPLKKSVITDLFINVKFDID
jgi:hypothetical protein